jgi:hypothetical protein
MARKSAINPVADGFVVALNVAAIRALCPGGVYRGRPAAQSPPLISVGPCSEVAVDAFGTNYGSMVTVPVHVITSGADKDGESRAVTIMDSVLSLLDEPVTITATGWTVRQVEWLGTQVQADQGLMMLTGETTGIDAVATFAVTAWPT